MIRGPVLPQVRETLWSLVSRRLDAIERGLTLVLEGLDCSSGQLGLVDGLARDAMGAPVLVLLAVDGDALLSARVLSACEFLSRVGDSLVVAVPEAKFCAGPARVLLVGTEASATSLEQLRRLPLAALQVCRLEPFRLAGTERFAVRWLTAEGGSSLTRTDVANPPEFIVSTERSRDWDILCGLCERIDPGVRIDGDRFWRRITWSGRLLGEVWSVEGELRAVTADGAQSTLTGAGEIRAFADQLMRHYVKVAGVASGKTSPEEASAARSRESTHRASPGRGGLGKAGDESLRSSLAAARLSPEEYSALGGSVMLAGGDASGATLADDVARIVAAQESPWPPPRRTD